LGLNIKVKEIKKSTWLFFLNKIIYNNYGEDYEKNSNIWRYTWKS